MKIWLITLSLVLFGCAEGHCRRPAAEPPAAPPLEAEKTKGPEQDHIFVYKYDGSLQCGGGKPVALEVMAKQLKGVQIFSSAKKNDRLMHIQVCGSNTGRANVYEILSKNLKEAEAKGFKKWSFEE